MKRILAVIGAVVSNIMLIVSAEASSCARPTPQEHIEWSDMVFFGQVDDDSKDMKDGKWRTINVKVIRAYKGVDSKTVQVKYINDGGGNMGWGFQNWQSVLIFANKDKSSNGLKAVGSVNYCSMITYHGRANLHPQYWDILVSMK